MKNSSMAVPPLIRRSLDWGECGDSRRLASDLSLLFTAAETLKRTRGVESINYYLFIFSRDLSPELVSVIDTYRVLSVLPEKSCCTLNCNRIHKWWKTTET